MQLSILILTGYVGAAALAFWLLYVYAVLLVVLPRGKSLRLSRLERWCRENDEEEDPRPQRPWRRFRQRHLADARAARRAQRWVLFIAVIASFIVQAAGLVGAVVLAIGAQSDDHPRALEAVAMSLPFLTAIPWLGTIAIDRALLSYRARTEWRAVELGERLLVAARGEIDQDFVTRRTGRLLTVLGGAFPPATAEAGVWQSKLRQAVGQHSHLTTMDGTDRRDWRGWVDRWLDSIAVAFLEVPVDLTRSPSASEAIHGPKVVRDRDGQVLLALTVLCAGTGGLGVVLGLLRANAVSWPVVGNALGLVLGTTATIVGALASLLAVVAFFRRHSR